MTEKQDQIRIAKKKISVEAIAFATLRVLCQATASSSNSSSSGSKTAGASRFSFRPYDYELT